MSNFFAFAFFLISLFVFSGCASVDDFVSSLTKKENPPLEKINMAPKYSENQNLSAPTDRQYKRMTKNRLEDESDLGSNAGSTWVMEGQSAYLFAQNKMRREGDQLNVKLDPPAMKQLETKVSVIKKLIKQLEEQANPGLGGGTIAGGEGDASRAPAGAAAAPAAGKDDKKEEGGLSDVQAVPSRIVERLPDGNFRIKGQQPFMIGKREYKVILTGMIRPEDFNDEGITTQKILDPQYDVVSIKRNRSNE